MVRSSKLVVRVVFVPGGAGGKEIMSGNHVSIVTHCFHLVYKIVQGYKKMCTFRFVRGRVEP